ncbi:hypothetical protein METBIDRAFT_11804 [Metschnikowia bicuspidata var. bicuspidata NRRL YB-4993]|uniref:Uncharacterized protein n=1 Tax=Metschnikowia bicuspidata var. bicuspidata NRRL YB-4993 TaxID=869754 RepID=A0A1A0HB87_9ASCO|nr:hypothetical protein METBIDRAFT_11804 [Metschnikowia bicuspidata var. bicuspidata NRRL YB-4993]OBA21250.1 hypothetical protein METBIDRAFT_11804 [Metschnikowia bicuspidata var. bicuspidata NRRL YB-4993]
MTSKLVSKVLTSGQARKSFVDIAESARIAGMSPPGAENPDGVSPHLSENEKCGKGGDKEDCSSGICADNYDNHLLIIFDDEEEKAKEHKEQYWCVSEDIVTDQPFISLNQRTNEPIVANVFMQSRDERPSIILDEENVEKNQTQALSPNLQPSVAEIKFLDGEKNLNSPLTPSAKLSKSLFSSVDKKKKRDISFEGINEYEAILSLAARDSVVVDDSKTKHGIWKKNPENLKREIKGSKSSFLSWFQRLKSSDKHFDGDSLVPGRDHVHDSWNPNHGPDLYLGTIDSNDLLRFQELAQHTKIKFRSNQPFESSIETFERPVPLSCTQEQGSRINSDDLERKTSNRSFAHETPGLEALYLTDEMWPIFHVCGSTSSSKNRKATRLLTLRGSLISKPIPLSLFCDEGVSEEGEFAVTEDSCTDGTNSDRMSFGSEIWDPQKIPRFINGDSPRLDPNGTLHEESKNELASSPHCASRTNDCKTSDITQRRSYRTFLRPLSLVPSCLSISGIYDSDECHQNAPLGYITDEGLLLQPIRCDSQFETHSNCEANSSVSKGGYLKELKLVKKNLCGSPRDVKECNSEPTVDGEPQVPHEAQTSNSPVSLPAPCNDASLALCITKTDQTIPKEVIEKMNPEAYQTEDCFNHYTSDPISKIGQFFQKNKNSRPNTDIKTSKTPSGVCDKRHTSVKPLWIALQLDSECREMRLKFVRGEDIYLFSHAFQVLRATFEFSDNTLELANNHALESSVESNSEHGLTQVKTETKRPFLKPIKITRKFVSLDNSNSSEQFVAPFHYKRFRQSVSGQDKRCMDKKLWANIIFCRQKVAEFRLLPVYDSHTQALDSFRECFKFCRENYAVVARKQILEYVTHLIETRNEILSIFELLVDVGYGYTTLLDFLVHTPESTESLHEAQSRLTKLLATLTSTCARLNEVHLSIAYMKEDFTRYVSTMVDLAQTAVLGRIESTDTYQDFCLVSLDILADVSDWHKHSQFDLFINELEFLMDRMELFQASTLEDVLNTLLNSHNIVCGVRASLELNVLKIESGIARRKREQANQKGPQGTSDHVLTQKFHDTAPVAAQEIFLVPEGNALSSSEAYLYQEYVSCLSLTE